jgi:DNA-binding NtrC family response regulator
MKKINVAMIDDEKDYIDLMRLLIEENPDFARFHFIFFTTGANCLKDIHKCDYLLTDITMPDMDAFELIPKARALKPDLKVGLMSAHHYQDFEEQIKSVKTLAFFDKPLNFEDFRLHLEQVFKNE